MLPRRSSNHNQRRSSILKPPKSRQPFQDLDFNASSTEISPESTKKRRVSFAEKKHVKEFCDHKEQGTIWDSTYEEADHSESKSTEISVENTEIIDADIENVEVMMREAGYSFLQSNSEVAKLESIINMASNNEGKEEDEGVRINSELKNNNLELTDIIPCSQGTSNDVMSIGVTETIGDSKSMISVQHSILSQAKEIGISCIKNGKKGTDNTLTFDSSDGEMNFTQIISTSDTEMSTRPKKKTDPSIDNRTIIYEDSIMELTLTESPTATPNNLEKKQKAFKTGDKTVLFTDFGCEMTEAIKTVIHKEPKIALGKENVAVLIHTKPISRISNSNAEKTVLFDDFNCEMTETVNTADYRSIENENVEETTNVDQVVAENIQFSDTQRNLIIADDNQKVSLDDSAMDFTVAIAGKDVQNKVTQSISSDELCQAEELLSKLISEDDNEVDLSDDCAMEFTVAITRIKDLETEIEESRIGDVIHKPEEISSELTSKEEDKVESLDDSAMEFTVAITRKKEFRTDSVESILDGDFGETGKMSPKLTSRDEDEVKHLDDSVMEFTTAITSRAHEGIEAEEENFVPAKSQTVIFDDCEVDITESVMIAPCTLNPVPNSEEQDDILTSESEESDLQNKKKRKCDEVVTDFNYIISPNSTLNKNPAFDVIQSLSHDESIQVTNDNLSNTYAPNCKRLKIGEIGVQENILNSEVDFVDNEELRNVFNSETVDRVTLSEIHQIQDGESSKICHEISGSNCSNVDENLVIDDNKANVEEVENEERSFVEAILSNLNDDSEADMLEYSRVHKKQQQSKIEKINDIESNLDPDKQSFDNNDDCCFLMFGEQLQKNAKSDNCIWTIRFVDKTKVIIDFISKSLVVVIILEDTEEFTTLRIIKDIQIISLLSDFADDEISMVHDILLKKLNSDDLKRQHRTTQDILPLLELISDKVKLLMDFMYEFGKLQDLHLISRTGNLLSFRIHSYKLTLAIKITINIEPFEDIGPNDVRVECILGNVREKDIKELIIGVKKDYRFLTNYIKDIKEYIALVVEK